MNDVKGRKLIPKFAFKRLENLDKEARKTAIVMNGERY